MQAFVRYEHLVIRVTVMVETRYLTLHFTLCCRDKEKLITL